MLANHNILLVDDEPAVLDVVKVWLTDHGCQVRCAADGKEAMAAIETECPQIMVVDWEMPNVNGIVLCNWVREHEEAKHVYILFLTARSEVEAVVEALSTGADDFLSKPVTKDRLLSRLHLAARRLGHAAAV